MNPKPHRFSHNAMACTFEIFILGEEPDYARQAAAAAFAEVDRLEDELSRFRAASDVARLNSLKAGEAARVGIDTFECLRLALQIQTETGGAFDVTFRSRGVRERIPAERRCEKGFSHQRSPGFSHQQSCQPKSRQRQQPYAQPLLTLNPADRSVTVLQAGVQVDLGAIGKGYAVDRMAALLRDDWKIAAALLHAGQSSVLAIGAPPGQASWPVALRDPVTQTETLGTVHLRDNSLGGSGRLLHGDHILDPRTGRPAQRIGTWALAPSAAESDALSTAFFIMHENEIEPYCDRHPEIAALLAVETDGRRTITAFGKPVLDKHGKPPRKKIAKRRAAPGNKKKSKSS